MRRLCSRVLRSNRRLFIEQLEIRQLLNIDWRNPVDSLDVDADKNISPLDVLTVINDINSAGFRSMPSGHVDGQPYFDVDGDGATSPLDPLKLINAINAGLQGTRTLTEGGAFVSEQTILMTAGVTQGRRSIQLDIDPKWDALDPSSKFQDLLAVYIVDAVDMSKTIVDRGSPGTSIFTMNAKGFELATGISSWDGHKLDVDISSITNRDTFVVKLQLLSNSSASGSRVTAIPTLNEVDLEGIPGSLLAQPSVAPASPVVDPAGLTANPNLDVKYANWRFDPSTGLLSVDATLNNTGDPIGRTAIVDFRDLPAGVTINNATGTTITGLPYISVRNAIHSGGLGKNQRSEPVRFEFLNVGNIRFPLRTDIQSGPANRAPVLTPNAPIVVSPGATIERQLVAVDPDGDPITYSLRNADALPLGSLSGSGKLTFAPLPSQIGDYTFDVIASDGSLSDIKPITLQVVSDPILTTRISGQVLNIDGTPIVGVQVQLGSILGLTFATGKFQLDVGLGVPLTDTIRVRGELLTTAAVYPFIGEKLALLLEHAVYTGVNNIIVRPIYLPVLDVANGKTIDPAKDTTVTTAAIPGASVLVRAGTLMNQQGSPFTGKLSITTVPTSLTPAALPSGLHPDLVVTIQPGEMVFATPAPLTLPNRSGWVPGTTMDLWSINPSTGNFDNVGTGRVSPDGSVINTVSGGIRNSSWHFYDTKRPQSVTPKGNPNNSAPVGKAPTNAVTAAPIACEICPQGKTVKSPLNSDVDLHSGAVTESHDLVSYYSLGQVRGVQLTYDSLRADPRPIIHAGYADADPAIYSVPSALRLVASLQVSRGSFSIQVPGNAGGSLNLTGGENFWKLPATRGPIDGALQVDLRNQSSGRYDYAFTSGILGYSAPANGYIGSSSTQTDHLQIVNSISSPFGSGWGLSGLQQIVVNPDGSLLLIDGNGDEEVFESPVAGQVFVNSPGDFSTMIKLSSGKFQRTLIDQTVFTFNLQNNLESMVDRVGNTYTYVYDGTGKLTLITDPVGLQTTFNYVDGRVSSITGPGGRTTALSYDSAGNLTQVTDPDNSTQKWEYDSEHHLTASIDPRGNRGEDFYDFSGRVTKSVRPDGAVIKVAAAETRGLFPSDQTRDPDKAPLATASINAVGTYSDGNNNVTRANLDGAGQVISASDSTGSFSTHTRNSNNLITQEIDARGHKTDYTYDAHGNVRSIRDTPSIASYTESGGKVVVEAEHFTNRSSSDVNTWKVVPTEIAGVNPAANYRGTGFLQVLPDANVFNGLPRSDTAPFVEYKLTINTTGLYQLYTRIAGYDGGSDSFYAEIMELTDGPGGVADFYQYTPRNGGDFNSPSPWLGSAGFEAIAGYPGESAARWNITDPGEYTLRFAMREDGLMIDSFILQLASLPAPTGTGPDETAADSGSGTLERQFTYDPTFNKLTSATDELGQMTLFSIDPNNGNTLSVTNVVGALGGSDDLKTNFTYTSRGLPATMTDPNGRVTDMDYDSLGRLIKLTIAQGTAEQGIMNTEYNAVGNITASVDANGNRTAFEYDSLNRLTKITEADPDDAGSMTSPITNLTYDAAGNRTKLVDPRNNATQLAFDVLNRISSRTDAIGGTSQLSYDFAGNLVVTKDELGRETRYRYDGRNRLVEVTNAAGGRRSMRYDSVNNLTASTDENGNTTRYAFDGRNRTTKMTDALGNVSGMFYNGVDNLVSTTDANSHTTQFAFDELNRLTSVTDAKGGIQSFEYDKASNLLASVDELNRRTQMAYDARDRRITVTSPLGKVFSSTYDAASNVKSVSDGRNQKTQLDYDGLHRLIKRTDALGGVASYSYDALGNMVSMTDERNRVTQLAFDAINRRVTTTDPLNHASQRTYDAVGNVITSSDGLGQLTSFTYDLLNRQAKMTDARGGITSYNYDPAGNLLSLSDADNNQTLFAYDALNRMESDTNALNAVKSYSYDAVGNLQSLTDRNNQVRRFSYDELDRQVKEEWLDATDNPIRTFTSTFDAASQLKTIGDPDSTYGYKYDIDGQLTSVANTGTPGVPDVVFGYNYDTTGNQSSRTDTITSVLKGTNAYSFDALNRMTRITQSGNNVAAKRVDLSYDAASQLTGIARFSDLVGTQQVASSAYVYDNAGRLTNLTHQRNSIALDQYAWTFDAANRIKHVTTPDGTTDYSYDSTNQLTAANHSAQTDESYSYDLNGNRTNSGNQTDANNRLKSDGTYNYQYDDEGNRISRTKIADREVTTYQWDYRNRLTQVTTKNAANVIQMQATYRYDVYDRRIAKIVDRDGAGSNEVATERFVYDGPHIALTFDGSGMQTHRFLHGPAIDQILADENQLGQILWPLTDNQGTVRDVIDSTGTLKDHIQYDSFGNILTRLDASIVLPFAYTGREFDKETGLYYYRARYFDSKAGSFISEDPIGFMGSSYHLSKYVRNNPINDSDPSGKFDLIFWLVVTPIIIYGGYKAKESITDVRDQARPLGNDQANIEWQRYLKAHPETLSKYKTMTLEEQRILMDSKQKRHEFFDPKEGMERIPNSATFNYFCHDYAWANKKKIEVKDFLNDLSGHGFERINREDLRVGDVVTYSNDVKQLNNPGHSSLVYRIDPDGTIWMRSKDVENSEFIHRLGNKGDSNFFRTAFGDELQYFRKITLAPEAPGAIQIFENQHQQLRDAMKD